MYVRMVKETNIFLLLKIIKLDINGKNYQYCTVQWLIKVKHISNVVSPAMYLEIWTKNVTDTV